MFDGDGADLSIMSLLPGTGEPQEQTSEWLNFPLLFCSFKVAVLFPHGLSRVSDASSFSALQTLSRSIIALGGLTWVLQSLFIAPA